MPASTGGVVGPKPVPHRITTSPGFAATVAAPAKVPFLTARLPFWKVATAWLPGHRKNAGAACTTVAVTAALVPLALVTVTGTGPVPTSGACTLTWPGLMKYTYAGLLPTFTLTPSSVVGSFPPTMAFSHVSVCEARFVPLMVNHEPGTMPGWKLAPLTTPSAEMVGAVPPAAGVS